MLKRLMLSALSPEDSITGPILSRGAEASSSFLHPLSSRAKNPPLVQPSSRQLLIIRDNVLAYLKERKMKSIMRLNHKGNLIKF